MMERFKCWGILSKNSISPDKVYSHDLDKLPSLQNYIQAHTIIRGNISVGQ
jgi:hypothetical protein